MRMKLLWTVLIPAGTVLAPVQGQQTTEQQRLEAERQEAARRAAEQRIKAGREGPATYKKLSAQDIQSHVCSGSPRRCLHRNRTLNFLALEEKSTELSPHQS
jgi:long-subunit fatty acid transport protein